MPAGAGAECKRPVQGNADVESKAQPGRKLFIPPGSGIEYEAFM